MRDSQVRVQVTLLSRPKDNIISSEDSFEYSDSKSNELSNDSKHDSNNNDDCDSSIDRLFNEV